jgi:hypothetical protein
MNSNPILREGIDIFFTEGHGFSVYFYILVILAPVEFLSLYLPSLDAQMWSGSASLFKVTAVTALLLTIYFGLRVANQEFASWRFQTLKRWTRENGQSIAAIAQGQLTFLSLHVGLSVLLCAPLLIWAAAIARTPFSIVAVTFLLMFFYAWGYSIWGLFALILWERRAESRQVFIRSFFFTLTILSLLVYLPLNPVAFLLGILSRQEFPPLTIAGSKWPAATVHFAAHLLFIGVALLAHRWALRRELTT